MLASNWAWTSLAVVRSLRRWSISFFNRAFPFSISLCRTSSCCGGCGLGTWTYAIRCRRVGASRVVVAAEEKGG